MEQSLAMCTALAPVIGYDKAAKIAKMGCSIYEVGIAYYGRTYEQGKKVDWRDGFRAIYCILKYNLFR